MTAGIVNQNLSHQPGCHGQEVCTVVSFKGFLIGQSKISLVNQSGALQGVSRTLPLEMVVRDLAQFLVDKRNQLLKSLPISGSPSDQQFTYGLRRHAHKSLRRRELAKNDSLAGLPSQSHHRFRAPEFAGVLFGSQFSGPFAGAFPQLLVEGQNGGTLGKTVTR